MLLEEQAATLLARCEKIVGVELSQTRGNLRKPESRAAAVWELLVIDAAAQIGSVEYEPGDGRGSPDICLRINNGRPLWLEAAYLYPRFWDEERRSYAVRDWLLAEAERRGLPRGTIRLRFDGEKSIAGFKRRLPGLHEKPVLLKHPELGRFFDNVLSDRMSGLTCTLPPYNIEVAYSPVASAYVVTGGLLQEAALVVSENAVYRVLENKARQHNVTGPRIVCIGSDQSPALLNLNGPGTGRPSAADAARAALLRHPSISCAALVKVRNERVAFGDYEPRAHGELILSRNAADGLNDAEIRSLQLMDFNRWKYTFPLQKWGSRPPENWERRVSGNLSIQDKGITMRIGIPTSIVVDALAGKKSVIEAFGLSCDYARVFKDGWSIVSCEFQPGNIESGEASTVVFEFAPPQIAVYWPTKQPEQAKKIGGRHRFETKGLLNRVLTRLKTRTS